MSTRDIQELVKKLYGVEVSPTLISDITDAVDEEVTAWRSRPLEAVWPIVYFDGIVVHVRGASGRVSQHTIYVALGVNLDGHKELLGLWLAENEGAKFWLSVLTDLKNRGLSDIFVACVDGLTGFPDAIHAAYPQTKVQLCVVHLVRAALRYVSRQGQQGGDRDLKKIYQAATLLEAEQALEDFAQAWEAKYPTIAKMWRAKWTDIITLFDFPPPIRKAISTTNAIESVNSVIRKFTRNRKIYPNEESALKIMFMAIREASKKWTMPIRNWKAALNHFAILFEDRMPNVNQQITYPSLLTQKSVQAQKVDNMFSHERLTLVAFCLSLICTNFLSAANYSITDLGDLGGSISFARGINENGQIVGTSYISTNPYVWRAFIYSNGLMSDLGALSIGTNNFSSASGINNLGQVIGGSSDNACLFSNGTITNLSALPGFSAYTAYGINDSGQIVGASDTVPGYDYGCAYLYTNDTMKLLGTLPEFPFRSTAYAINNKGQVVGTSWTLYNTWHAFLL